MSRKRKIKEIADQIIFYSEGKVLRPYAEAEADAYLRRRGFSSWFVHEDAVSGIGKKLAYKCMGTPMV